MFLCRQDVSEFQHKLLEWLEDAFKSSEIDAAAPSGGVSDTGGLDATRRSCTGGGIIDGASEARSRATNPMVKLFYGQYLSEGVNEGKYFDRRVPVVRVLFSGPHIRILIVIVVTYRPR